jgi:hypothetical protein
MKLATGLLVVIASCVSAAVVQGVTSAAVGKGVLVTNIEEGDGYIIVTFSGLQSGAVCAPQHKNALLFVGKNTLPIQTARSAFSLGQAVDVWGSGMCTKRNNFETLSGIQLAS